MRKAIYKGFRMQVVTYIVFLKIKGEKSFICKNECFEVGVSSITLSAIILISGAILWNISLQKWQNLNFTMYII